MAERYIHENARLTRAQALVYPRPMQACLKEVQLPVLDEKSVLLQTLFSGISRGTEGLVFSGKVPPSEWERMRCPYQSGDFSFPISYGYALVGKVMMTGTSVHDLSPGDIVFTLHPHQSHAVVEQAMANKLEVDIPPARAVLTANTETALNAIWDSSITAEDRVCVVGAGVVGLLTAFLAQKISNTPINVIDVDETKRQVTEKLGLTFAQPDKAPNDCHVVFHTSANEAGLQTALDIAGFEGRIIEMSWYGNKPVNLSLGGAFHSQRLQIIASQVGHVSPSKRSTTSYKERMVQAMSFLRDPVLDHLLEPLITFKDLPDHLPTILGTNSQTLCQVISYDNI